MQCSQPWRCHYRHLFCDLRTDAVVDAVLIRVHTQLGYCHHHPDGISEIATLPLTIKQYKSMAAMKKIQPLMKSLQEKYSDDKAHAARAHEAVPGTPSEPLAGCLPMVVMMPIYFAHIGRSTQLWSYTRQTLAAG